MEIPDTKDNNSSKCTLHNATVQAACSLPKSDSAVPLQSPADRPITKTDEAVIQITEIPSNKDMMGISSRQGTNHMAEMVQHQHPSDDSQLLKKIGQYNARNNQSSRSNRNESL